MIEKILVPLDGSRLATSVFSHVVTLAKVTHAQVTLLTVLEKTGENTTAINPLDWQLRRIEAERYLEGVASQLNELLETEPEINVLEGTAADRIIEYAQKQAVDLIVLSSHGQGGINGRNVNSVAQKVIQGAGKSILLAPAWRLESSSTLDPWAGITYRYILAPLDGSQRAETVLPVLAALAQTAETQLHLVHVITRPEMMQRMPLTSEEATLADNLVERNQVQVTHYLEQLQARLPPQTHIRVMLNGHIAATLHQIVGQEAVDLVVLSAHGFSGHDCWPYGSLANSFITYGATPLLILQDMPQRSLQSNARERNVVNSQPSLQRSEAFFANPWQDKFPSRLQGKGESLLNNIKKVLT